MISFVLFSMSRAWQGFWRNAVMSLAATATMILMLLLLAGFWIIQTGLLAGLQFTEQKVEVVAYLQPNATDRQVSDLQGLLKAMPQVASVAYVSRDEALVRFRASMQAQGREDLTRYLDANPLYASLEVTMVDPSQVRIVGDALRQFLGVGEHVALRERPELERFTALAAQRVAALGPDRIPGQVRVLAAEDLARADQVGVERAGQPFVGGHQDRAARSVRGAGLHERMIDRTDVRDQIAQHRAHRVRVRPRSLLKRFGATNLRRGDLLHRLGDLLRVLQRSNPIPKILNSRH